MSRRGALSPVGRETLHDRVYAELRRSLIHGMFDAGEMLRIQDLAETLQTSTMPVREALGRLVSEQALEALPNRSVRVPLITRERLDDLARARCLIEGEIVALALPNLGADDFAALARADRRMRGGLRGDDRDKAHAPPSSTTTSISTSTARRLGGADPDRGEPVAAVRTLCARRRADPRRAARHSRDAPPLGADRGAGARRRAQPR